MNKWRHGVKIAALRESVQKPFFWKATQRETLCVSVVCVFSSCVIIYRRQQWPPWSFTEWNSFSPDGWDEFRKCYQCLNQQFGESLWEIPYTEWVTLKESFRAGNHINTLTAILIFRNATISTEEVMSQGWKSSLAIRSQAAGSRQGAAVFVFLGLSHCISCCKCKSVHS